MTFATTFKALKKLSIYPGVKLKETSPLMLLPEHFPALNGLAVLAPLEVDPQTLFDFPELEALELGVVSDPTVFGFLPLLNTLKVDCRHVSSFMLRWLLTSSGARIVQLVNLRRLGMLLLHRTPFSIIQSLTLSLEHASQDELVTILDLLPSLRQFRIRVVSFDPSQDVCRMPKFQSLVLLHIAGPIAQATIHGLVESAPNLILLKLGARFQALKARFSKYPNLKVVE